MTTSFPLRRLAAVLVVGLFLVGLTGCGRRASVQGTVTFDGTPIDNGSITFVPESSGGQKASAQIKDGKYSIESERGPSPGKYKVEVTWMKVPPAKKGADPDVQQGEGKQMLPDKFNTATTLTADISSGSNTVNFDLKSN